VIISVKRYRVERISFDWLLVGCFVAQVTKAGGKFVSSCTKDVTHVVSTQDAVDNGGPVLAAAVKLKLPVVTEEWIDKCIADGHRLTESGCLLRGEVSKLFDPARRISRFSSLFVTCVLLLSGAR